MFRFASFTLDTGRGCLRVGEREVDLRAKSFALLTYFVENSDRLITKDELISCLWPNVVVTDESLTHCVSEVRRAIGDDGQTIIRTVPRRGYRFAAPISRVDDGSGAESARKAAAPSAVTPDGGPGPSCPAVAVLAFLNLNGDPQQDHLGDALAEDIITELSRFSELSVVARNSSFEYRGKATDIRRIGHELGVSYVLEGSLRRSGDRLRITAQLIDARTGIHRWAEKYDRHASNAFEDQDEITGRIVATLVTQLKKAESERSLRKSPALRNAYDHFLHGMEAYRAHVIDPVYMPICEVRRLLEKSIATDSEHARDPQHAQSYALLARTRIRTFWDPVDNDYLNPQGIDQAYELARRAVLFDGNLPIAHFQLGLALLFKRRQEEALNEFEHCIALNPNNTDSQFGFGMVLAGRSADAVDIIQADLCRDPFGWPMSYLYLGQARYMQQLYEEALRPLKLCASRISGPGLCVVYAFLAAAHAQLGQIDGARNAATEVLRVHPDWTIEKMIRALPYNNQRDIEHLADGLRKAALPIA